MQLGFNPKRKGDLMLCLLFPLLHPGIVDGVLHTVEVSVSTCGMNEWKL